MLLTLLTVGLGLLIAILVDRVRYESFAKAVIFVPLAISMVAAGGHLAVHVRLRDAGRSRQIGTLNALSGPLGAGAVRLHPDPRLQHQPRSPSS